MHPIAFILSTFASFKVPLLIMQRGMDRKLIFLIPHPQQSLTHESSAMQDPCTIYLNYLLFMVNI